MIEILIGKIRGHFSPSLFHASLQGVSDATRAENYSESGMIRTQMGSKIDQKMVAMAWDALYDTNRNSNQ
jgi:hypothetical protein